MGCGVSQNPLDFVQGANPPAAGELDATNGKVSRTNRSATTNDPLSRADGRTAGGRRVRDLYREFSRTLNDPQSLTTQAAILAVAELTALCELRREQALQGEAVDLDQLIRLESMVARKLRRLGVE